ncbi:hypothetical protein MYX64_08480 [Nitrospinae bacterium AH_259_B05_G02_I21]|nr:hypothetical protein [Nitrospinae bacterium AH_259_B05_G02_I21]MDA2932423.1 hypothetical protein [Nitrospinae bacterium AH-259-F20]
MELVETGTELQKKREALDISSERLGEEMFPGVSGVVKYLESFGDTPLCPEDSRLVSEAIARIQNKRGVAIAARNTKN